MSKPREFAVYEMSEGLKAAEKMASGFIIEYRGKVPSEPIHVIEKSAYDDIAAGNEKLKDDKIRLMRDMGLHVANIEKLKDDLQEQHNQFAAREDYHNGNYRTLSSAYEKLTQANALTDHDGKDVSDTIGIDLLRYGLMSKELKETFSRGQILMALVEHCRNRDTWIEKANLLEKDNAELVEALREIAEKECPYREGGCDSYDKQSTAWKALAKHGGVNQRGPS